MSTLTIWTTARAIYGAIFNGAILAAHIDFGSDFDSDFSAVDGSDMLGGMYIY
jgi:hypothetical protein